MIRTTPGAVKVGEALIRHFEGCVLHPYRDIRGLWTIGWGNRSLLDGTPVLSNTMRLTQAEADQLQEITLRQGLLPRLDTLVQHQLNDNQAGALMSLAWNIGTGALAHSQVLAAINRGNLITAGRHIPDWCHVAGRQNAALLQRRHAELAVWDALEPEVPAKAA